MTSIAVFGTSGSLGKFILDEFQDSKYQGKVQYPIKAITTKDKSEQNNDKVKFIKGDISSSSNDLATELAGTDVIINLTQPIPEILENLEKLVKTIKPKIYIPSEFGCENDVVDDSIAYPGNAAKAKHAAKLQKEVGGTTKVVTIYTAFFRIPPIFLYGFIAHVGIDKENKTVTYVGNDETSIPFSTGPDIGKVVATVALTDPSKVLLKYRVYSGVKKIKELVEDFEQETGSKFTASTITLEDVKNDFLKSVEAGSPNIVPALFYCLNAGPGGGLQFAEDEREVINPDQSLWKWGLW